MISILLLIAACAIFGKARYDFLKAKKHYIISWKNDIWTVRDKRGRFVLISENYWDVCALGAKL